MTLALKPAALKLTTYIAPPSDASGNSYFFNCSNDVVVGDYTGSQMVGFAAAEPLGLIEHLQDGKVNVPYPNRRVAIGGNTPYILTVTGTLPKGLKLNLVKGILSGKPTKRGTFTVIVTDSKNAVVSQTYSLKVGL